LKISEIRALGDEEMKKRLEEAHQELFNLRFRAATRQLANHREIPKVKKRIARLKTIINERELEVGSVHGKDTKN
jgi:large subunit ribosomal protein L29